MPIADARFTYVLLSISQYHDVEVYSHHLNKSISVSYWSRWSEPMKNTVSFQSPCCRHFDVRINVCERCCCPVVLNQIICSAVCRLKSSRRERLLSTFHRQIPMHELNLENSLNSGVNWESLSTLGLWHDCLGWRFINLLFISYVMIGTFRMIASSQPFNHWKGKHKSRSHMEIAIVH